MIWLASFFVAVLAATVGAFSAGAVGIAAVKWYRIPGREGASGYFVVVIGLFGIVVGFLVGVICGFSVHADSAAGFFKAFGLAVAIVVVLAAVCGIIARLMADVPPTCRGEKLFLIVEGKWPARQASPAREACEAFVRLGSLQGHTLRKSERGQLWKNDATRIDGNWIVRGAVEVFTSRGKRLLEFNLGSSKSVAFLIPLPAFPRKAQQLWSEWMPRRFPPTVPLAEQIICRFRVQRQSEPMRIEAFGNFEIVTITEYFHEGSSECRNYVASYDSYRLNYQGAPLSRADATGILQLRAIVELPNTTRALLASVENLDGSHTLSLLRDMGDSVLVEPIVESIDGVPTIEPIAPGEKKPQGGASDNRFAMLQDGLYRVGAQTIFDTRTLTTHRYSETKNSELGDFRSLMLSPDERSFARFTFAYGSQAHVLEATDFISDRSYSLPIDRARMRYVKIEHVTPAWAEHHFQWERDAVGVDQLVERTDFKLLPFHGEEVQQESEARTAYYLYGSTEAIGDLLQQVLVEQFGGVPQLAAQHQSGRVLLVGGVKVDVFASSDIASVTSANTPLIQRIGRAIDAELATYKHDALFTIK